MPSTAFSITELLQRVRKDYPAFVFCPGELFRWSPMTKTITYDPNEPQAPLLLLHELGHALLAHELFDRDIQLIRQESAAWEHATTVLAPKYGIAVDTTILDEQLQTYRQWLYLRSLCPSCSQTGIQTTKNTYSCMNCRCSWRVNDARQCNLRRLRLLGQDQSAQ